MSERGSGADAASREFETQLQTLNVRAMRRLRQNAKAGLATMYLHRQTGPGGLPLAFGPSEGVSLGRVAAVCGIFKASFR
jgi:hypothetical protein